MGPCAAYTSRMRPALLKQDSTTIEARIDQITKDCAHAGVEKHKRFTDCIKTNLFQSLATCAVQHCQQDARACVIKNCNLVLPTRPEP